MWGHVLRAPRERPPDPQFWGRRGCGTAGFEPVHCSSHGCSLIRSAGVAPNSIGTAGATPNRAGTARAGTHPPVAARPRRTRGARGRHAVTPRSRRLGGRAAIFRHRASLLGERLRRWENSRAVAALRGKAGDKPQPYAPLGTRPSPTLCSHRAAFRRWGRSPSSSSVQASSAPPVSGTDDAEGQPAPADGHGRGRSSGAGWKPNTV